MSLCADICYILSKRRAVMDILVILKDNNISKARFAHDLNLSRPTLDEYIKKHETGESLPKSKYQIIFDSLFSEELSADTFAERYKAYKEMLKRDKLMRLDNLSPEDTDSIIHIVTELKQFSSTTDSKSQLIPFIEFLSMSYTHNPIVDIWVKYFNYLNNYIDNIEFTDIEKKYIGNLYHLNDALSNNQNAFEQMSDEYFKDYIQKRNNLIAANTKRAIELKKTIQHILEKSIAEVVTSSNETVDNDEMVKKVLERIAINAN